MGSDEPENIVTLCLNHHWVADFGTEKERLEILKLIKDLTGKSGKRIPEEEITLLDNKVFILQEENLGKMDNEKRKEFRKTSNYLDTRKWLLCLECPPELSRNLNEKAEKLILIDKLKKTIPHC